MFIFQWWAGAYSIFQHPQNCPPFYFPHKLQSFTQANIFLWKCRFQLSFPNFPFETENRDLHIYWPRFLTGCLRHGRINDLMSKYLSVFPIEGGIITDNVRSVWNNKTFGSQHSFSVPQISHQKMERWLFLSPLFLVLLFPPCRLNFWPLGDDIILEPMPPPYMSLGGMYFSKNKATVNHIFWICIRIWVFRFDVPTGLCDLLFLPNTPHDPSIQVPFRIEIWLAGEAGYLDDEEGVFIPWLDMIKYIPWCCLIQFPGPCNSIWMFNEW